MKIKITIISLITLLNLTACEHTNKLEDNDDVTDEKLMRLADKMYAQEGNEMAAKLYTQILKKDPENSVARIKLARLIKEEGYYHAAINELSKIPPNDANFQDAQAEIILCYMESKETNQALNVLNDMLRDNPDNAKFNNLMGVCYDVKKDHTLAQEYYNKALDIDPNFLGARSNLGLSLALSGQYEDAIATLKEVNKSPSSTSRDRQNLAVAYALANDPENAEKLFLMDMSKGAAESNLSYLKSVKTSQSIKLVEEQPLEKPTEIFTEEIIEQPKPPVKEKKVEKVTPKKKEELKKKPESKKKPKKDLPNDQEKKTDSKQSI